MKRTLIRILIVLAIIALIVAIPQVAHSEVTPTDLDPIGSLTLTKTVNGQLWRIRCDYMYMDGSPTIDSRTINGTFWKRDWITNVAGNTSKEGHRLSKCGDAEHWVIWADTNGVPYRMDEIKSGATGSTLPTIIYRTKAPMSDYEIAHIGDPDHPEYISKYKRNFQETMPYSDIRIGERLYWITFNNGQVWYHTGIPYAADPSFVILINGEPHILTSGQSVEIEDLKPGIYEISEVENPLYSLGQVISSVGGIVQTDKWTMQIQVLASENNNIIWPNLQPEPTDPPSPPNPPPTDPPETDPPETDPPETDPPAPEPTETPVIDIEGYKVWHDKDYESERPEYIIVHLYVGDTLIDTIEVRSSKDDVNEAMWSYVFKDKPQYDENGNTIIYTVKEEKVDKYETVYRGNNVYNVYITPEPTEEPTTSPTEEPTVSPTEEPTISPTEQPTEVPTEKPTEVPTPTTRPTPEVTATPTITPEPTPTATPEVTPTPSPSPTPVPRTPIEWEPPTIPEDQPQPDVPARKWYQVKLIDIEDYETALGLQLIINHVGDCYD